MKPIEPFYFLKHNNVTYNATSLMQSYFPIIGSDALAVYDYFVAFYDNGQKQHKFSDILNHLQFGMHRLEVALDILTALDLIVFYETDSAYLIKLHSALPTELFLENPVYRKLLEKKIGEVAVEQLICQLPFNAKNISKSFSEVFSEVGELKKTPKKAKNFFDLANFKQLMSKDGLSFNNETDDVIGLYHFAEQFGYNWFETYQIAKETAVNYKISLKRMQTKKQSSPKVENKPDFSKEEQVVIKEAKADNAEVFLAKIKKMRHATITATERKILSELADMGFLDEVINVMVLYTMSKTNSANLNKTYIMMIANDFSYQNISSVEQAVIKMRSFAEKKNHTQKEKTKQQKSNVPKWSNDSYKNETTEDEQAKLEEMKRRHLEKLRKKED
ncbi:DnaD domain protein [Streptococcus pacificus]|uniref:DnaD domain protein n=1 Tax=Streptococcus pacificus TaxID=2740577 RepID=A0ABS0ZHR5_9STRE|nr:DnaD domain protein [Streptococcus pacificus]MBJ8325096.1 DnaD domain protein [Streptococcus pacificus]